MKKLFLLLLLIISVVSYSQSPIIGSFSRTKLNFGTGINSIIVPINWINTSSGVTFSGVSSNPALFSITGISYNAQTNFAVIYGNVPKTTSGILNLNISASNGNGTTNTIVGINIGEFYQRGALFSVYDIVFWQRLFPDLNTAALSTILSTFRSPTLNSFYCPIGLKTGSSLNPGQCLGCVEGNFSCFQSSDGMTIGFTGFLTPTLTGIYTFTGSNQDNFDVFIGERSFNGTIPGNFFTSNDSTSNILLTKNKILNTGPYGVPNIGSYVTTLIGGLKYAIRAAAWPVFTKNLVVQWAGPGFGIKDITPTDILPYYDLVAPTVPSGLTIKNKGVNFVRIQWNATTDNQKLMGYNVYVDGLKFATVSGTSYAVSVLGANTRHSIAITAFDLVGNESNPSNVLNTSTYPTDVTLPSPPTVFTNDNIGDLSALVSWSGATDVGSEIIGYNVSLLGVGGNLLNQYINIFDPSNLFKVLQPSTVYKIKVQSIDGGFNVSAPSADYIITTTSFNALITAVGIKKVAVSFFPKGIGRNEGFGINYGYTDPLYNYYGPGGSTVGASINTLIGLNPSLLRWGTLSANTQSYSSYSGTAPAVSIGDFLYTAGRLGGYASYTLGIAASTDWVSDPQTTALRFMEYIAGPISTNGGARRNAEGYTTPLINNLKGLLIEFGNEAWGGSCNSPRPSCSGGVNHNCDVCYTSAAPTTFSYTEYGRWAREVARYIKSSPYYAANKDKIKLFYSGRNASPNDSYGLNLAVMAGDTGEVDGLAISGYSGGNLNYDPAIPRGQSQLQYFQNCAYDIASKLIGLQATMNDNWTYAKAYKPFFFYESNMTQSDYFGKLGQAILMTDYFLESTRYGSILPSSFALSGGEWTMISPTSNAPLPLYSLNALVSKYSKGNMLDKTINTLVTLSNSSGVPMTGFDPVGAHLFYENGKYAMVFFSRDYTIDYQVQVNNLSAFLTTSSGATLFNITSNNQSFSDEVFTTTTLSNITLQDGMIVNVPKYGMLLMTFAGKNLNQSPLPLGYTTYRKISTISIAPRSGYSKNISVSQDLTQYETLISNNNPFSTDVKWTWSSSNSNLIQNTFISVYTISGKQVLNVQGGGPCNNLANGVLKIRATAVNDPLIFAEDSIIISNQYDAGSCAVTPQNQTITFSPIPNKLTSSSAFTIHAYASSGLPVSFTVISGPATITDSTVYLTGVPGNVVIQANQLGNSQYNAAPAVNQSFNVTSSTLLNQSITFDPIPNKSTSSPSFILNATATSGLPVSFTLISGPANISGNTVILTGSTGTVIIQANQAGNGSYNAAPSVNQSFNVTSTSLINQTITFNAIPNKLTSDPSFAISATASSNLPITYTIDSGPANISGNIVTLQGIPGIVKIKASQGGNGTYNPALDQFQSFTVSTVASLPTQNQTINFSIIPDKLTTDNPFTITATASSGLPVTFAIVSGPAVISGNTISLLGTPGHVTVRVSQAGNVSYNAANPVDISFNVLVPPSFTITPNSISGTSKSITQGILISTTKSWTAAITADWISVNSTTGNGVAVLLVTLSDNITSESRSGQVIFISDNVVQKLYITQEASKVTDIKFNNKNQSELIIYPNPSTGKITIESTRNGIFKVINSMGINILESELMEGKSEITLADKGIYICEIQIDDTIIHKKIIIK
ncbi:MAG: fibronectin type III domain-containing protein [Bacteroidota bacterium]|nr:fibronectin type III domain-containing protein [Bacteroidota bacterium]